MADTVGQTREDLAALKQFVSDCQLATTERRSRCERAIEKLENRVDTLERNQTIIMTKFSLIISLAAFVATVLAQVAMKLVFK